MNFTFSVQAELRAQILEPNSGDGSFDFGVVQIDGTYFPSWGGAAQGDGPQVTKIRFYWSIFTGASYSATASLSGIGSVPDQTVSGTFSGRFIPIEISPQANAYSTAEYDDSGRSIHHVFTGFSYSAVLSDVVSDRAYSASGSDSRGDWSTSYNNGSLTLSIPSGTCDYKYDFPPAAQALLVGNGLVTANLNYHLRSRSDTCSDSVRLDCTDGSSGPSRTITQYNFSATTAWDQNLGAAQFSHGLNQQGPVAFYLNAADLASSGNDTRDWRCYVQGAQFAFANVTQDVSKQVYDGSVIPAGGGTVSPAITQWNGYRRASFTVTAASIDNQACSVTIAGKRWDFTTGAVGVIKTITLDLCAPSSASYTVDTSASIFPLSGTVTVPGYDPDLTTGTIAEGGDGFGVGIAASMVFACPGGGGFTLGAVSLVRSDAAPKIDFTSPFLAFRAGGTSAWSDSYNHTVKPYAYLKCDGKRVADWPDMGHNSGGSYDFYYLADLAAQIRSIPGWHAVEPAQTDPWLNNNRLSLFAFGGGALWNSISGWKDGIDVLANTDLYAAPLYDVVQLVPGMGEALTGGALGPSTTLPVYKGLKGWAEGLVFKSSDGSAFSGASVVATDSGAAAGSGTSGADGSYHTGLPYGRGNHSVKTELHTKMPFPSSTSTWQNRLPVWLSFRGVPSSIGAPWVMRDPFGRYHRSTIESGDAFCRRSDFSAPLPGFASVAQVTMSGDVTGFRMIVDPLTLRIYGYAERPLGVYETFSDDDGKTWSALTMAFSTGLHPTGAVDRLGSKLIAAFRYVSGSSGPGNIFGKYQGPGDASYSAEFELKDSTGTPLVVTDDCYHFWPMDDGARLWNACWVISGDSGPSDWWSGDDGKTWTRYA